MSLKRRFKTEPPLLSKIKNLLEGYDGLTIMTAVEPKKGIFELIFTEGLAAELDSVIKGIGKEVPLDEIQP
ncbi:MAG: DUF4911 domain-containing protein [Proteobacteria bacterium]|nr:DUF4911 domain-containing protein [Pseudomonadota bacterium]